MRVPRIIYKPLVLFLGIALLAEVSVYRAFFHVFTHAPQYDDTGTMLSLIQGFNEHGGLYREIYSPYGPFCSEFYFVIGKLLHVPITQDGIRWVVIILWTLSSVVGGLVAYRLTNKIWIALLTQAFSFHELYALDFEPGHPISLVALLLGALALALCIARDDILGRTQAIFAGCIIGMLTMVKINLAVFAIASVGTALIYCAPRDLIGRITRWLVAVTFCGLAIVLIGSAWPRETRIVFLIFFLCNLLAVLVSVSGSTLPWSSLGRFGLWGTAAGAAVILFSVAGVLLTGTGVSDLARGVIFLPLGMVQVFASLPDIQRKNAIIAVASLIIACVRRFLISQKDSGYHWVSSALRLAFVGILLAWVANYCTSWTALAFLWIAVLPISTDTDSSEPATIVFGRVSLVVLAVGQLLGLYPVSGAQVGIPFYLTSLCLSTTLCGLFVPIGAAQKLRPKFSPQKIAAVAVLVIVTFVLTKEWRSSLYAAKQIYQFNVPLQLPGSNVLRLNRVSAATYKCLAENLRTSRPTFISVPGMDSLYGWAERPYPIGLNVSLNFSLFTDAEQRRIVEVGRTCAPIAVVRNNYLLYFWTRGRFQPSGPLIDFVRNECRSIARIQGYDLMYLKAAAPPVLTYCATLTSSPNNEIILNLPSRFAGAAKASLLQWTLPGRWENLVPVYERRNEYVSESTDIHRFAFSNPDPTRLTEATADHFIVQVWTRDGELLADVPFALPVESETTPAHSLPF
jgi:hypothetical protein